MKNNFPPQSPSFVRSEMMLHGLFVLMATGVIGLSFLMSCETEQAGGQAVFVPGIPSAMPPLCGVKRFLGVDCPGCGLTRAFISISHGRWADAWRFHLASFLLYGFVVAQIPWHMVQLSRLVRGRPPIDWPVVYAVPIGVVIALVLAWVAKFVFL